ncbi:MAG TPA: GNAT family N-acetyltransferase [Firmicutes bacterium]|nr:GNAT family N-acetyltransferase [Bacillota bacterium]
MTKYLTWPPHADLAETEKIVREIYLNKPNVYAITLKDEPRCIGCIELRLCPEHHKASFGYVLNRNYWNRGYMTETGV